MKVLLVSPAGAVSARIQDLLARAGARVECRGQAPKTSARFDLGLLLPGRKSFEDVQALRRLCGRVLLLAGPEEFYGPRMSEFIACGADGIVLLSLSDEELSRRFACADAASADAGVVEVGGICLDVSARTVEVLRGKRHVRLKDFPPKEFDLLRLFLEHPHAVLARAAVLERLWGARAAEVNAETLDRRIGHIRRKLGAAGRCIRSVRGVGYVFEPKS
ncbi:MAG: winged helix-turn-helix domain-containing protein [Elusimicrobiota bacterium]